MNEVEKEGMDQLERLAFCARCTRPFLRQWVERFKKWSKVCPGCLLKLIMKPDESE